MTVNRIIECQNLKKYNEQKKETNGKNMIIIKIKHNLITMKIKIIIKTNPFKITMAGVNKTIMDGVNNNNKIIITDGNKIIMDIINKAIITTMDGIIITIMDGIIITTMEMDGISKIKTINKIKFGGDSKLNHKFYLYHVSSILQELLLFYTHNDHRIFEYLYILYMYMESNRKFL